MVLESQDPLRRFIYKVVMSKPFLPVRHCMVKAYYRLVFGRCLPYVNPINKIVRAFELCRGAGDIPVPSVIWESQYRNRYWDFLTGVEEVPHYSVLAGYLRSLKPGGSVLDVGCGEGILQTRLGSEAYSRYVGFDCSEAAISIACKNADRKTLFQVIDAACYVPAEAFDAIVFNEVLYYFDDPLAVFARYTRALRENGVLLTSLFMTERSSAILRRLKCLYPLLEEVSLRNQKTKTWVCSIFHV
jgi:2-polyprenyl-3-methyl-5-hydroxy-6-metoxy-1,4-benzoquinol methylase